VKTRVLFIIWYIICSNRGLLRQWEQLGQAKIVLTCKNQQEMNRLKETAEHRGIPTFIVADAGRTQVLAGSKTVLAIGPGRKADIDAVTGKLRLLWSASLRCFQRTFDNHFLGITNAKYGHYVFSLSRIFPIKSSLCSWLAPKHLPVWDSNQLLVEVV